MNEPGGTGGAPGRDEATAGFRYGAVFLLTLLVVVFIVAAPGGDWSRAVSLALEFAALLVVIETSGARRAVRRTRAIVVGASAVAVVLLTGFGVLPAVAIFALAGILAVIIPLALVRGLVRLLRARGVTAQTVAGALAIYLLVGLLFASVIGFAAHLTHHPYFTQGTDGTQSERVYYSFTVLTTTGFGDLTAAVPFGRALAVVEMLTGQLYLVTVIGMLVGHIAGSMRRERE